ncbi:hypothetical protein ACJX0J_022742, partial [Zea mays]
FVHMEDFWLQLCWFSLLYFLMGILISLNNLTLLPSEPYLTFEVDCAFIPYVHQLWMVFVIEATHGLLNFILSSCDISSYFLQQIFNFASFSCRLRNNLFLQTEEEKWQELLMICSARQIMPYSFEYISQRCLNYNIWFMQSAFSHL